MAERYQTVAKGAELLRHSAVILEAFRRAHGDEGGAIGRYAEQQRAAAAELDKVAKELRPSPAMVKWSRGNAAALKNWNVQLPLETKP